MSNSINAAKGISFHLAEIRGYVTGHVFTDSGHVVVFGRAWWQDEPDEMHPGQMVAMTLKDRSITVGAAQPVADWKWITVEQFDEIVGMNEIRKTMGWR